MIFNGKFQSANMAVRGMLYFFLFRVYCNVVIHSVQSYLCCITVLPPGKKYDGPEVDVWSLGVILYTLVSGSLPFDGQNLKELRERVLRGKYRIPFYMSTDCENLLKKFLVLNPVKRACLENIMKDKWMNISFEEDELKPYKEIPIETDSQRIDYMVAMGYNKREIEESLRNQRYDDVTATYLLLGRQRKNDGTHEGSESRTASSTSLKVTTSSSSTTHNGGGGSSRDNAVVSNSSNANSQTNAAANSSLTHPVWGPTWAQCAVLARRPL